MESAKEKLGYGIELAPEPAVSDGFGGVNKTKNQADDGDDE